jgi:hypothetical protein
MSRSTDPDRVLAEDPATIRLKHDKEVILARLRVLVDPNINEVFIPDKAPSDWPKDAIEVHERYQAVSTEIARLNSRHMSRQLSRFLGADDEDTEKSKAMQRWWMNRY